MNRSNITIVLSTPVMTYEKFASESGLRTEQVKGQVTSGNLDKTKIGRLNMINIVALTEKCAKESNQ